VVTVTLRDALNNRSKSGLTRSHKGHKDTLRSEEGSASVLKPVAGGERFLPQRFFV
jgi:hypothetical protein